MLVSELAEIDICKGGRFCALLRRLWGSDQLGSFFVTNGC